MWSHKEPDFALHMLCELQKQQQCSLHCDILLQTDGISIPAHSCVLSAVSPVFSRAFASSPSVPLGQSRLVSLQTVRARALLKLVGFMYSGEMEGEGLDEQQEVFDVAHMLGFTYLTDGKKKLSDRQQEDIMTWRTIGLHRERRKKDASVQILSDKKIFMHLGTQTGGPGAETDLVSETLPNKMKVVTGGSDSISTPAGFDCDNNNVSSPSNISEALVRVQTKHQQIQPEKKHVKMPDMGGTQISLKIKLKRQMSGALWEIVSVHEENTTNGSKACDSASERCDADQRMTNNHTEVSALHRESSTLTQTHRNCPEIHLSPSPTFTAQNLGTVTLTPPSDLTASSPFRPLSEHSFLCTPHPILLSPPLQMSPPPVSPDLAQPEESDEQIVRLLEDMDMMGLSILPSVSMERIGDLHHLSPVCSHLDQKIDACEVAVDAPNRNLSVYGDDQGINASNGNETSSGSSGQEKTGSECSAFENLDLCTTVELQNDASISSSASLAVTSPFIRQDKNHELSLKYKYNLLKNVPPSDVSFGPGCLEIPFHRESELNNSFNPVWSADTNATNASEEHFGSISVSEVQDDLQGVITVPSPKKDSAEGKRCLEGLVKQPHRTDHVQVPYPADSDYFSDMRIPTCLSPLASEESAGAFTLSNALNLNLQPVITRPPHAQTRSGRTDRDDPLCVPLYANQTAHTSSSQSLVVEKNDHAKESSGHFANQMLEVKENVVERRTDESRVKRVSTFCMDHTAQRKRAKMTNDFKLNRADTQTEEMLRPCSVNRAGISNLCAMKPSKTAKRLSQNIKSQVNLPSNLPLKHTEQDVYRENEQQDLGNDKVVHRVPKRPHKGPSAVKRPSGLVQTSRKLKDLDGSSARPFTAGHHTIVNGKSNVDPSEGSKAKKTNIITSVVFEKAVKQPNINASPAKKPNVLDKIFHKTGFNMGTITRGCSVSQQLNPKTAEAKSLTLRSRELADQDHMINKKLGIASNENAASKSEINTWVPNVYVKPDKAMEKRNYKTTDKIIKTMSKNGNGRLLDCNPTRDPNGTTDTDADFIETLSSGCETVEPDGEFAPRVTPAALGTDFNNNIQIKKQFVPSVLSKDTMNNIQTQHKKPNSVGVMNITESVHEIGASSVRTENSHLQETTDTQTVHPEAWNEEKTIERTDTEAARVVDIGVSEEQGCETSDVEVDVMDQSNQVLTGTGDETPDAGWTTDDTDVDDGQALALKGQLIGLTVLPSNEAITQIDSPVVRSQKDVSQEDSGWTDLSRSSLNTLGSSAVLPLGENEDQAKDDGSDEEDVIVDVLDSPDVPPFNLAGQQSVRIWANNEDELEEEDEVDVLM